MAGVAESVPAAPPESLAARARTTVVSTRAFRGGSKGRPQGLRGRSQEPTRKKVAYGVSPPYERRKEQFSFTAVKSIGTRRTVRLQQKLNHEAVARLRDTAVLSQESEGYLVPEGLEKTHTATQRDIVNSVDLGTQSKVFQFDLSFGPYKLDVSRNGRYLLAGGKKGSLSLLDLHDMRPLCEINVHQTVRDVQLLHNHTLWAAAQKKYLHIYDQQGIEVHCLRDHMLPYCLDFLPYHFLLVSIGEFGELSYLDVSTGLVPARHKTKRGACFCLRQNPENGVVHLGHSKGTVTLWTPNMAKPAVEMLCHKGGVTSLGLCGNYMVTAGADGFWKIWDNRTYESLSETRHFGVAPNSVDCSQSGLIALSTGAHVQIWKDVFASSKPKMPYLTHAYQSQVVESVRFRPFEDLCLIGTSHGFGTLLVPGAGKANIDSRESNPFETKKQRRESEVRSVLEKLQPDMISLNPKEIGSVDKAPQAVIREEKEKADTKEPGKMKQKNKKRGRQGALKRTQAKTSKYSEALRLKAKLRSAKGRVVAKQLDSFSHRRAIDRFRRT